MKDLTNAGKIVIIVIIIIIIIIIIAIVIIVVVVITIIIELTHSKTILENTESSYNQ